MIFQLDTGPVFTFTLSKQGPAGPQGFSIRTGAGAPSSGLGVDGDSYVDSTNGDVYARDAGSWTLTGSIKGAKGDQGVQGFSMLSGVGVPGAGLGVNGDSYLNVSIGDTYAKSGGAWALTGNIRGLQGVQGFSVYQGSGAPSGALGVNGDSYVNVANGDIYLKLAGSWGSPTGNIKGPKGDQGATGATWYSGTGAPSNGTGVDGDYYLNASTGDTYKKASGSWGSPYGNLAANSPPVIAVSSSRAGLASDAGSYLEVDTSSGAVTYTVNTGVFTAGLTLFLERRGANDLIIAAGAGVTLRPSGLTAYKAYRDSSVIGLHFHSATDVTVFGEQAF